MRQHPAIGTDSVAVVTGGASGIGLAVAQRLGQAGMQVVIADFDGHALEDAERSLVEDGFRAIGVATDVGSRGAVEALKAAADALGQVTLVMSNAGREGDGGLFEGEEVWRRTLKTDLWGAVNVVQVFVPDMIAGSTRGAVICTGSKQGITLPPGDTAYNVSKAGLKALTESLAHDLVEQTGDRVTAHLLIPGFTYTGFTQAKGVDEKPDAAWSAGQVAEFMLAGIAAGDFYILCPDNDVDRATDLKRMRWSMGDIMENRPALSRWHPDFVHAFRKYMERGE